MPFGDMVSGAYIVFILFIVPGLLSIKVFRILTGKIDTGNRLDAIVYSITVSLASLFILYLFVSFFGGKFLKYPEIIRNLNLPTAIHGYGALISVSLLLGMYHGLLVNHWYRTDFSFVDIIRARLHNNTDRYEKNKAALLRGDQLQTRSDLWDYIFDKIYSDSKITVVKTNGEEVSGEVLMSGDSIQARDLLITAATLEDLEDVGSIDDTYTYLPPNDISHIHFNEDLNKGDAEVANEEFGGETESENPGLEEVLINYDMKEKGYDTLEGLMESYDAESKEELIEYITAQIPDDLEDF